MEDLLFSVASVLWLGLAVLLGMAQQFTFFAVAAPICTALLAWTVPPLQPENSMPDNGIEKAKAMREAWITIHVAQAIQIA